MFEDININKLTNKELKDLHKKVTKFEEDLYIEKRKRDTSSEGEYIPLEKLEEYIHNRYSKKAS